MGFVVGFWRPGWDSKYYLSTFVKSGDCFRPLGCGLHDTQLILSFRGAWFIAQNMRRAGYQAEVQYVK